MTEQDDRADDIAIAADMMGLEVYKEGSDFPLYWCGTPPTTMLPRYSRDIESAWLVVNKLIELGWQVTITQSREQFDWSLHWVCQLVHPTNRKYQALADTPAKAICAAALMTIPKEKRDERSTTV